MWGGGRGPRQSWGSLARPLWVGLAQGLPGTRSSWMAEPPGPWAPTKATNIREGWESDVGGESRARGQDSDLNGPGQEEESKVGEGF